MIQRFTVHSETILKPSLEQDEISEGLKVGEVYLQRLNKSDLLLGWGEAAVFERGMLGFAMYASEKEVWHEEINI